MTNCLITRGMKSQWSHLDSVLCCRVASFSLHIILVFLFLSEEYFSWFAAQSVLLPRQCSVLKQLVLHVVVQRVDNFIHWIVLADTVKCVQDFHDSPTCIICE